MIMMKFIFLFGLLAFCSHSHSSPGLLSPFEIHSSVVSLQKLSPTSIKRIQTLFDKKEVHIAFVGDSITEGWDLPASSFSYVNLVTKQLRADHPHTKFSILNASLGSRCLRHFLDPSYLGYRYEPGVEKGFGPHPPMKRSWILPGISWFDTVKNFSPDVVIIAFGVNDAFEKDAEVQFAAQLKKLFFQLQTWPKKPEIAIVTNPLVASGSWETGNLLKISAAARQFAWEHDLIVLDINRIWIAAIQGKDIVAGKKIGKPFYQEVDMLGVKGSHNGNSYNHPTAFAHHNIYFAAFQPLLQALKTAKSFGR